MDFPNLFLNASAERGFAMGISIVIISHAILSGIEVIAALIKCYIECKLPPKAE